MRKVKVKRQRLAGGRERFGATGRMPVLLLFIALFAQAQVLDDFESSRGWIPIAADAVEIDTATTAGLRGQAIRIDFNFTTGTGYCGIRKQFPLELPENFQFTFYLKGEAPLNNFEFKLVDESGDNVWWCNQRNFEFPTEWRKITIKKRHIQFAWGPAEDRSLKHIDKIEFFVASSTGGKGSIYLDDFRFETLAIPDTTPPNPLASTPKKSDKKHPPQNIFDGNPNTYWLSAKKPPQQDLLIDLQKHYEYGGLIIEWDETDYAEQYNILISQDQKNWEPAYTVTRGKGGRSYIYLKDSESRYLKLQLLKSSRGKGYAICDLYIKGIEFSDSPNNFVAEIAKDRPRGYFPRYFYNEQSYWTIVGVNNDDKEALINEEGLVEVDKTRFSIEPFLYQGGRLLTWNEAQTSQSLEKEYLPIPSATWVVGNLQLQTQIFAAGPPDSSVLYLNYTLSNAGADSANGALYLAIRPFQVNTPWQFLNWPGGTAKIKTIRQTENSILVNEEKAVVPLTRPDGFGAAEFDKGDITDYLSRNTLPNRTEVTDHFEYASAALKFAYQLAPSEKKQVFLVVPFHDRSSEILKPYETLIDEAQIEKFVKNRRQAVSDFWEKKINTVEFNLPASANRLVNTIRSNLAYILINRDGPGIQPGSRSYERSWIRDGSLTSSALLKFGIQKEVKAFLNWYSGYQYPDGKVPCVVDRRGPDPVPENDSHGQLIFAILQYYRFTGDESFLEARFENVRKAVEYMDSLSALRRTEKYLRGDNPIDRACYGLLPESISHEGYSAKPMHSYWDDFFALRGYHDAVEIAHILGRREYAEKWSRSRDTFRTSLYNSLKMALKIHRIDYIPGCVELGDFDATSTAIAIYPGSELRNLPQPQAQNTFDRYYEYFQKRLSPDFQWKDYTPYEVRLIGSFIYLDQIERAHELIKFFFSDQKPAGWNHWAEVVRKGERTPGFIGDMPHTWVGSDFLNAARAMFVYEDESSRALVVGEGLYDDWINAPEGMSVRGLPTYYGILNYSIQKTQTGYRVELSGDVKLPEGWIKIRNFKQKPASRILVNGTPWEDPDAQYIHVPEFPAVVEIWY